jgi:hypothetical protein
MHHPSPRERNYPAGAVHGQTVIDFGGYLLRGVTILGIVDHALREDSGTDNDRLSRNPTGNPFNVWAVGPIDVFHMATSKERMGL